MGRVRSNGPTAFWVIFFFVVLAIGVGVGLVQGEPAIGVATGIVTAVGATVIGLKLSGSPDFLEPPSAPGTSEDLPAARRRAIRALEIGAVLTSIFVVLALAGGDTVAGIIGGILAVGMVWNRRLLRRQ